MRIASLISSGTEILFALGLRDEVVAVGYECDYPPHVADIPRVTRSNVNSTMTSSEIDAQVRESLAAGIPLYEIDTELLCALAPTLIVTQSQCDVCAIRYEDVKRLVATEPSLRQTRIVTLNPHSVDDIFADIMTIAAATERTSDGLTCVAKLRRRIADVNDQIRDINRPPPRVACIEWTEPFMLAANWTPEVIRLAGGESLMARAGQHSVCSRWADLIAANPDVILVAPCGFDLNQSVAATSSLSTLDGWSSMAAVRTNHVWAIDGNAYLNRAGPRIVDSIELVAHLLHPERFPLQSGWSVQRIGA